MSKNITQKWIEFSVVNGPSSIKRFCDSLMGLPGNSVIYLRVEQSADPVEIAVVAHSVERIHTPTQKTEQVKVFGRIWGGEMRNQEFKLIYNARSRNGTLLIKPKEKENKE